MADSSQRRPDLANGSGKSVSSQDQRHTAAEPAKSRFGRTSILWASVLLSVAAFLASKNSKTSLSESYAICSRAGEKIYTVDEAGSHVQCLAIHKSEIVDTGFLGENVPLLSKLSKSHRQPSAEIQERWNSTGGNIRSPLAIRYIDEGSIIVPGMSGRYNVNL